MYDDINGLDYSVPKEEIENEDKGITWDEYYAISREIQYMEMNDKKEVHNNNAFECYSLEELKELLNKY